MNRGVCFYLEVHQPFRVRPYTIFDIGSGANYFDSGFHGRTNSQRIFRKVAEKSYLPTNALLLELLREQPAFKLSLSLTGVVLEQMELWGPDVLSSFQQLVETGRVELLSETYHHSLSFFYSRPEFEIQINMHREKLQALFGQQPAVFRNTELAYNNELGQWAEKAGYKAVLAEGWEPVLGWRSANFAYRPAGTNSIKLLLKNYKLSDDIAFRFSDRAWSEWPLTVGKFAAWLGAIPNADTINLFMDYETFGEHQWVDTGIFDFMRHLPNKLISDGYEFLTISQAAERCEPKDTLDIPHTVTWADTERDLSAWLGNDMQQEAVRFLYDLENTVLATNDWSLIEDWRKLQTSDHFYYMCTKWFNDGDIHAYFSPYETPYVAFLTYMNALRDIEQRAKGAR